ncbi:MAG: hypothetical protein OXD50_03055 [Chloroflexi bacterium]|nr:hypothetical protein [Chloroflexota bacterium]
MRRLRSLGSALLAACALLVASAAAIAEEPEPLTLTVSSVREICTFGSVTALDYAIDGGQPPYQLRVDGRRVERSSDPNYIPCRPSALWTRLGAPGDEVVQRMIASVSDATGARAFAVAELRLVPPLPALRHLRVSSGVDGRSAAHVSAEWSVPYLPREQRTEDFAIRWRVAGASEWNVEHHRGEQGPVLSFRTSWTIDAPPTGEQREVQIAQLRHIHDLQAPQALLWSPTALVTTAATPHELQAEATHDAITLRWGPHAPGLRYGARLSAVGPGGFDSPRGIRVSDGPVFEERFDDLLPDTLYRVEVYLNQESRYRYSSALVQHRFEIRTEQAPAGWRSPSRSPTNITARLIDGELEVTWTPPSTGSRHDTLVCAHPPEYRLLRSCDRVAPGEARVRIPLQRWLAGGTFAIEVETATAPAGVTEVDLHVPSYDPDLTTRGAAPESPQFFKVSWSHLHHDDPKPARWRLQWNDQDADLAEVTWQEGDRQIIRETSESEFSISLGHGQTPGVVRIRLLKDGAWTPWSAEADVARISNSYRNVRLVERAEVVEVYWEPPDDDADVVGYRLYVRRNYEGYGEEEVIDVGPQVSAEIPIRPTDQALHVNVATLYEGPLEVVHVFHHHWHELRRQPEPLERGMTFDLYAESSPCPPWRRAPLRVEWRIRGGTAPFTLSIADRLGFESDERDGSTVVECQTGDDGELIEISAQVIDSDGRTAVDAISGSSGWGGMSDPDESPFEITSSFRSVHRDRVLLSWSCRYWPFTAVLRWRLAGEAEWTYTVDFPQARDEDWRCRGTWDGRDPVTTYEYQLARLERPAQLRSLEQLHWTESQTVSTLGPPQQLSIERHGDTVTVQWHRQPDAWAYVVGLRTAGRSWWKRYEPSGEPTETVYFYAVPSELSLRVELMSPPRRDGEELRPRWFDANIPSGH